MRDYEELVKRLRICPDYNEGCKNCPHEHDLGCRSTMMWEAADAIEGLQKSVELEYQSGFADGQISANRKKNRWISVKERPPEDHVRVLLCNDEGKMVTGERAEDDWWYCYYAYDVDRWDVKEQGRVIAWMPLPEPPKEEADA